MAGVKMSQVTNKGLLVLLGLTIAYQIVYQAFMLSRLQSDDNDSDAVCEIGALTSGSPHCLEMQLFRTWQRAEQQGHVLDDAEEELEKLTQVRLEEFRSVTTAKPKTISLEVAGETAKSGIVVSELTPMVPFGTQEKIEKLYNKTMATLSSHSNVTPWAQQLLDSQAKLDARLQHLPSVQHDRHQKFEEQFEKLYEDTMEVIHQPSKSSYAKHAVEMMAELEQQKRQIEKRPSVKRARALERQARLDGLYNQTLAAIKNRHVADDYAKELSETMHDFEDRADHLPSLRRAQALAKQSKFDELYETAMARLKNHSSVSDWADHLQEQQAEMQYKLEHLHDHDHAHGKKATGQNHTLLDQIVHFGARLCNSAERQQHAACRELETMFSSVPGHSDSLQHAMSAEALARHERHENWRARLDAEFASHTAQLENAKHDREEKDHKWKQSFEDSAHSYLEDLCSDPDRAGYPACATLRQHASTTTKTAADSAATSARLRGAPAAQDSERQSASTPSGRLDAATSRSLRGATVVQSVARPATSPTSSRLRGSAASPGPSTWADVVAAGSGRGKASQDLGRLWKTTDKQTWLVSRDQLMSYQWTEDKKPAVACIVAITPEDATDAKLVALISNFRLQTYEGRRVLMLLHRNTDTAVGEMLQRYANSSSIRAVAVRSIGEFPSTTALRYGAWAADAEIIARWNMDEWYHPQRLTMQIESMLLSGRPASLLKSWTVHGTLEGAFETNISDKTGWEGSLVGEASWMKSHWMPLLSEERHMLDIQSYDLAQVDMPELMAYDVEASTDWHDVLSHFNATEDQVSRLAMPSVCSQQATDKLEDDFEISVGAELSDAYKALLASRHAVSGSLQTLCEELAAAAEPPQHHRLVKQAEHIAELLQQMNNRFGAVRKVMKETTSQ
eukprot:TRINITY_DN106_c0_g2_i1.p1 TRINITY_DN106_c0_g2~~TRINITY_DN106_c0_g2_i1.p1  ORF type:complete len:908 (-),score=199.25 TRINITY_DN106_c0_g2_i1:84-2807(-)